MDRCRRLSLGILGLLVLFGGITMSLLILLIIATWNAGFQLTYPHDEWRSINEYANTSVWTCGFAFIIPGVVFILAALIQHKAAHIISSIIGLLSVLAMGLFAILAAIFLIGFAVSKDDLENSCHDTSAGCECAGDNEYGNWGFGDDRKLPFKECHYLFAVVNLCVGLVCCLIFSWIFLLTASILAICYSCRSNPQTGIAYVPLQDQQVVVSQASSQVLPQPTYPPRELMPYPNANPSSIA